ncbi:MAG: HU family DNA-binding protein [Bacteroidaceae bacterium]|nr:HU family DNA-binding protein [Bacteroidaceae bacterium]
MNNKEFTAKLAQKCKLTNSETTELVDALVEIFTERLKENDQINILGFGVLEVKLRRERVSVNPKSGQRMLIPPKIVPSFRPSAKLKDKFKDVEE